MSPRRITAKPTTPKGIDIGIGTGVKKATPKKSEAAAAGKSLGLFSSSSFVRAVDAPDVVRMRLRLVVIALFCVCDCEIK
jgi:hypothetical protein